MKDNLKDFVEQTNRISEQIGDNLFEAVVELRDEIVKKGVARPLVISNASLRACMILLARVMTTMAYEAEQKTPKDPKEFLARSGPIFEDIVTALIPVLEKNVKAIMLRTDRKEDE